MTQRATRNPLAIAIGTTVVAGLGATLPAQAGQNPFTMTQLSDGYLQVAGEGKCGGMKKSGEGKCGGKTQGVKAATKAMCADKIRHGFCGEGKCGEGKCGASLKEACAKVMEAKCGEAKCGEGKCGAKKSNRVHGATNLRTQ